MAQAVSEKDFEKAMSLRDPDFAESLDGFMATSVLVKEPALPKEKVSIVDIIIRHIININYS